MQLRAEEISQIIKKQIQSYEKGTLTTETGTVIPSEKTLGDDAQATDEQSSNSSTAASTKQQLQ
jgi:hypothetical protein